MGLKKPATMDECVYFTRRAIDGGQVMAWTLKKQCPKCKKGTMGKPVEKGKVKMRATEYVCPDCKYTEETFEHEKSLTLNIEYTCPKCKKSGETTTEYKRKTWQGVPAYIFECGFCKEKTGITKKMKKPKKKGAKAVPIADDE